MNDSMVTEKKDKLIALIGGSRKKSDCCKSNVCGSETWNHFRNE